MKRLLLAAAISLAILLLLTLGLFLWTTRTADGSRWLLQTVAHQAGFALSSDRIAGRLADRLEIDGLTLKGEGFGIAVERLVLEWHPWALLDRHLQIERLDIAGLVLLQPAGEPDTTADSEPETSADAASELAVLPLELSAEIKNLEITDFVIRQEDATADAVIADRIAGSYRLAEQQLQGDGFIYHSPYVELDGQLRWDLARPLLDLDVRVHLPEEVVAPQLFADLHLPTRFPARLELTGTWREFQGPVQVGRRDGASDTVWIQADSRGSWRGLQLEDLEARYLGGTLAGRLEMAWIERYQLAGTLQADDLQLSQFVPELTGGSNFRARGELLFPYDGKPFSADLKADLGALHLYDQTLRGKVAAGWTGPRLDHLDLDLRGQGVAVVAAGLPRERLEFTLQADDLGRLHPQLAGTVAASGWLRLQEQGLYGQATGKAQHFTWQELAIDELDFAADYQAEGARLDLQLDGHRLRYAERSLARLEAQVSGRPADHRVRFSTTGEAGNLQGRVTGQYRDDRWLGRLQELRAEATPWGEWQATSEAELAWSPDRTTLNDLYLAGPGRANLTLAELVWQADYPALLDLSWSDFDLRWLEGVLPVPGLSGETSGQLVLQADAAGPTRIEAQMVSSGRLELAEAAQVVNYRDLDIHVDWDAAGLAFSLAGQSADGEQLVVEATSPSPPRWGWPGGLALDASWERFDLARLNYYLEDQTLAGRSAGRLNLDLREDRPEQVFAEITARGTLQGPGIESEQLALQLELDWHDLRFASTATLDSDAGWGAALTLTSPEDPAFAWPEAGRIDGTLDNLRLELLNEWLPENLRIMGRADGAVTGGWRAQRNLRLEGHLDLTESHLDLAMANGQLRTPIREGRLDWQWQEETLTGSLAFQLSDQGKVRGRWQLPLPARLPTRIAKQQPVEITVTAELDTLGTVALLTPWALQDLKGEVRAEVGVQGTWAAPELTGFIALQNGQGYLPATGAQVEDWTFRAELHGEQLQVKYFSLRAGPGTLTGTGEIDFDQWRLDRYRFTLSGQQLQIYDYPDIQAFISPNLEFSGDLERLRIRGNIRLPRLNAEIEASSGTVAPSEDVEIVRPEQQRPPAKMTGFQTDMLVIANLGDKVWLRGKGLETRLSGDAVLTLGAENQLQVFGEIRLVEGTFRAYGTNLKISQGILRYQGDPPANPNLSVLAVRETGNVQAGVQIAGTAEAPEFSLYSSPGMPERDIISYMLTGRAASREGPSQDELMIGAGTLLPADFGPAETILEGIYVGTGGLRLRYRLADRVELESTFGTESAVDLYYIFRFD